MERITLQSKVDGEGILHVALGPAAANADVQVTVEPAQTRSMSQDEWRQFIVRTSGSITDPSFRRWEQGDYEERETL